MLPNQLTKNARTAALAAVAALAALAAGPALAAAPMPGTQAPGYYRLMLGQFEVTALSDGTVDLPADKLLSHAPEKTTQALARSFLKTPVETSVNAYLVNTGSRLVLIDTGAGALFGPTLGKLMDNLKASGYRPEDVDDVLITHLHPDHVGGLVANGVPSFPNAVVHADQRDADFWLSQANLDGAPEASKGFFQGAMASMNPYVNAGKYRPFTGSAELLPGVRSYATPGHTAGHASYVIESQGQKLLLVGDLIHVAAVQMAQPAVTIGFDVDARAAAAMRGKVFTQAAKDGVLVGASHIQFPGLGRLRAAGKGYQWVPVNYTRMR